MTLKPRKASTHDSLYDHERWYFGCISRDEAEKLLKLDGIERGDFLIRNSERKVDPDPLRKSTFSPLVQVGHFSLSIRAEDETIRHFRIEATDNGTRFLIGKRSFPSFDDLIEHYKTHPVFDGDQNNKLYLNQPLMINDSPVRS